ncbi:MAG TPA: hypothetical protein VFA11_02145 [Acidimicrobiales bacterium]|nr:hypothetical protein [Acidimicrobiales bacterium]
MASRRPSAAFRLVLGAGLLGLAGLPVYLLWPAAAVTQVATAAPPAVLPTASGPAGALALTPPAAPVTTAPPVTKAPAVTAPPAPTNRSQPATATAPAPAAAAACTTLPTSSAAVLGAGCYVETALDHPDVPWPASLAPATSSESIQRGEVWDGLSLSASASPGGLVTVRVTLANHSAQTMQFPAGLVVKVTLTAPGSPTLASQLADPSVRSLAPGGSVALSGPVALTAPGVYAVWATVAFAIS